MIAYIIEIHNRKSANIESRELVLFWARLLNSVIVYFSKIAMYDNHIW